MNICKQTFYISQVHISQKVKGILKWNIKYITKMLVDFQIRMSVRLTGRDT